ncbi:unnamed protein product [Pedinophyceae sp. YPF-701]|nr:unnamed protein product [Pedinophyceae sp. YPF-701]
MGGKRASGAGQGGAAKKKQASISTFFSKFSAKAPQAPPGSAAGAQNGHGAGSIEERRPQGQQKPPAPKIVNDNQHEDSGSDGVVLVTRAERGQPAAPPRARDSPSGARPADSMDTDAAPDALQAGESPSRPAGAATIGAAYIPSSRDPARQRRLQHVLAGSRGGSGMVEGRGQGADAGPASGSGRKSGGGKLTPLEQQVVALKRDNPGTLLAVEVGYKFRFFGEDAEAAAQVCKLYCYTDHSFLTASVPVARLFVHVRRLVEAGHRVGVVRQVETAALKSVGDNRNKPFERKLTGVYTKATLEAGLMEDVGEAGEEAASGAVRGGGASYLLCVCEEHGRESDQGTSRDVARLGIVAVEVSTGDVLWEEANDGPLRELLDSRLLEVSPVEVLLPRGCSRATERTVRQHSRGGASVRVEAVDTTLGGGHGAAVRVLTQAFGVGQDGAEAGGGGNVAAALQLPALALQALAVLAHHLQPFGLEGILKLGTTFQHLGEAHEMKLSPNVLEQLEIFEPQGAPGVTTGRSASAAPLKGTLLWQLDHTRTGPGARLLRRWIARPSRRRAVVDARLDAVEELLPHALPPLTSGGANAPAEDGDGTLEGLPAMLRELPDLERALARMYHGTAAPWEAVSGLKHLADLPSAIAKVWPNASREGDEDEGEDDGAPRSPLLRSLLRTAAARGPAQAAAALLARLHAGACTKGAGAQSSGAERMFACRETFPEVFDQAARSREAREALDALLPKLRKELGLPSLQYTSVMNQGDFLVEVPRGPGGGHARVPAGWELVCGTKKVERFHPPEVKELKLAMDIATERLAAACVAAWRDFLGLCRESYVALRQPVRALAEADALLSLATASANAGWVRPEMTGGSEADAGEGSGETVAISIEDGRHPLLDALLPAGAVPNSVELGGAGRPRTVVVTGPNMGGKSCYLKQVALTCMLAQIGCFVPAKRAVLPMIDNVLARMGAADSLAKGISTFQQELMETSTILRTATPRSLVIIDELGRGTSTHDGLAIALAATRHLTTHTRCLTLLATHYPQLAELSREMPADVAAGYMSYTTAEEECAGAGADAPDVAARYARKRVGFLYKLTQGVAPASYGLNVARMAGLPGRVVERAAQVALDMELGGAEDVADGVRGMLGFVAEKKT